MKWIDLAAYACDPKSLHRRLTTHCIVIIVAVDESGIKVKVPEWIPQTEEEKQHHATAIKLMEMRKKLEMRCRCMFNSFLSIFVNLF